MKESSNAGKRESSRPLVPDSHATKNTDKAKLMAEGSENDYFYPSFKRRRKRQERA